MKFSWHVYLTILMSVYFVTLKFCEKFMFWITLNSRFWVQQFTSHRQCYLTCLWTKQNLALYRRNNNVKIKQILRSSHNVNKQFILVLCLKVNWPQYPFTLKIHQKSKVSHVMFATLIVCITSISWVFLYRKSCEINVLQKFHVIRYMYTCSLHLRST